MIQLDTWSRSRTKKSDSDSHCCWESDSTQKPPTPCHSDSATLVLTLCFKVFMPPQYTYYIGAVCFFFFNTDKKNRCDSYKTRRPCVLANISIVAISVGLPVAIHNPVPVSQVGFQQFRATITVIVGTPVTI